MTKTAIIIIAILGLIIIAQVYISSTNHNYYKDSLSELRKKQAVTARELRDLKSKTKIDSVNNLKKEAAYMDSKREVERYKKQVNNARKKERDEIQRNKTVIPGFTNLQVDSAFKFMYPRTDSALYH